MNEDKTRSEPEPPSDERLTQLVERLAELRDEKRYLEGEIERVSTELGAALEPGFKGSLGGFDIRVTAGRRTLRVTSPDDVPPEMCSMQPDRKAILAHIEEGKQPPPGVESGQSRPTISVKPTPPSPA